MIIIVALHPLLAKHIDHIIIKTEDALEGITGGITVLIHKKEPTNIVMNHSPITCVPTYYKLLILIFR